MVLETQGGNILLSSGGWMRPRNAAIAAQRTLYKSLKQGQLGRSSGRPLGKKNRAIYPGQWGGWEVLWGARNVRSRKVRGGLRRVLLRGKFAQSICKHHFLLRYTEFKPKNTFTLFMFVLMFEIFHSATQGLLFLTHFC